MTRLLFALFLTLFATACATPVPTDSIVVTVTTEASGVSAELIESTVTVPIERVVVAIPGVVTVRSVSSQGKSYIEVGFGNAAREQQLSSVHAALSQSPLVIAKEASQPVVGTAPSVLSLPSQPSHR